MSNTAAMVFSISKEALSKILSGEAILSSGGVRALTGELLELAKPLATSVLKNGMQGMSFGKTGAVISIASTLGSNVQCGFIQHSINLANVKLDTVLTKLNGLANAMQGLQAVHALSWVNAAFGLANCCISAAGFHKALTKLDSVGGQLKEFYDLYRQNQESRTFETYQQNLFHLKGHLSFLRKRYEQESFDLQTFKTRESSIENILNNCTAFLHRVLRDFQGKNIDGKLACQIIFTLSAIYSQVVNEYCCRYFYAHDIEHDMYQDWVSVLNEIDSEAFKLFMRQYMRNCADYITISPVLKRDALQLAFEGISEQKNRLAACAEIVHNISEEEYLQLDDRMNQLLYSGLSEYFEDELHLSIDAELNRRLAQQQFVESDRDNSILIPLEFELS